MLSIVVYCWLLLSILIILCHKLIMVVKILKKTFKIIAIFSVTLVLFLSSIVSHLTLFIISFMSSDKKEPIYQCQTNTHTKTFKFLVNRNVWVFSLFLVIISSDVLNIIQTLIVWRFKGLRRPQLFIDFILVSLCDCHVFVMFWLNQILFWRFYWWKHWVLWEQQFCY